MVIPEGYCQVNLMFTGAMLPTGAQVTFGIDQDNSFSATTIANIVGNALTTADVQDRFSNQQSITSIRVKKGPTIDGPYAEVSVSIPGQSAGDMCPQNTALLVRKVTGTGGRHGSGRFFWPGILAGDVTDTGAIGSTASSAWSTQFGAFLTALDTADCTMVLLHGDDTAPMVVTSLVPQAKVATQRRRLRR